MSEMVPPLIYVIRAQTAEFMAGMRKVRGELAETKVAGDAAGAGVARSAERGTGRARGAWGKYAGAVAAGSAIAGAAVAYESVKMASNFQSQMTLLQTAGGEVAGNMKTVSSGIMSLATSTGTSTTQLSEGMYTLEKAGIRGADGLKVLRAAAEGAKAEGVDLGTATNALTSVMMSYHMSASQATQAENMMVEGAGKAKTTMENYAGSLSTVIPIASAAGVGFDQVAGAIATLTQHGTSADEATQELSNTIRNLQAPNQVAQKAMQQLGLDVNDVSKNLGKRGLTGTIDMITEAIKSKMGPSGLVAVDAFKKQQSAAADLQLMLTKMPPKLAELSKQYMNGKLGMKDYQTAFKDLGGAGTAMGTQFLSLSKNTQGFNDLVKSGQPAATTMAAYLKQVMGGATGLNTALMLGGENMRYFKGATEDVAKAGEKTGKDISTWAQTQGTLKVQLAQAGQMAEVMGIKIGTKLIPVVSGMLRVVMSTVEWFGKHKAAAIALAVVIGTVMVAAIGTWIVNFTRAQVKTVIGFAKMIAEGATWVAETAVQIATAVASWVAGMASWVATQAASIASSLAMWVTYAAQWIAQQAAMIAKSVVAGATWVATMVAQQAAMVAASLAKGAVWVAGMIAQGAMVAAANIASAAATAAAWVAANVVMLAVGGAIVLAIAALVVGIIELVKHWSAVWGAIKKVMKAAWEDVIKPIFHYIKATSIDPVIFAIKMLGRVWGGIWGGIKAGLSAAWNDVIKPIFGFIKDVAIDPIMAAIQDFANIWNSVWNGVQTVIQDVWNIVKPIIDAFKDAFGAVTGFVGKVGGFIGKGLNMIGLDTGGPVPGAVGAPMPAIVHGGEYMLSHDMLTGKAPIDPDVAGAVMGNVSRDKSASSAMASNATYNGGASGGGAGVAGGGGGDLHVHIHAGTIIGTSAEFAKVVQSAMLQHGTRNPQAYAPFKRS